MKSSRKKVIMLFTFLILIMVVFCNLSSVSMAGMYDEDDSGVNYSVEYVSQLSDGDSLIYTGDTKLIMDDSRDRYFYEAQILNGTLKIELNGSGNLYFYGSQAEKPDDGSESPHISYPGIFVPKETRLIIEQTSDNAGYLTAVGGCGTRGDYESYGTSAGIGGCGYYYDKDVGSHMYVTNNFVAGGGYMDAGTIIIKSGTVFACGGTAVGKGRDNAKGTGAGIGGGGIHFNDSITSSGSKVHAGKAGVVKILGGNVFAIGGGTAYADDKDWDDKSIYWHLRTLLFEGPGFSDCDKDLGNYRSEGTGAGIGNGGVYLDATGALNKDTKIYAVMDCSEFKFNHYNGALYVMGGGGGSDSDGTSAASAQGSCIGGGGIFVAKDVQELKEGDITSKVPGKIAISSSTAVACYCDAPKWGNSYNTSTGSAGYREKESGSFDNTGLDIFRKAPMDEDTSGWPYDLNGKVYENKIYCFRPASKEGAGVCFGMGGYNRDNDNDNPSWTNKVRWPVEVKIEDLKPQAGSLKYALSQNASIWYDSEQALYEATEDVIKMEPIYVKFNIKSTGQDFSSVSESSTSGIERVSPSSISGKNLDLIYKVSTNEERKVTAKAGKEEVEVKIDLSKVSTYGKIYTKQPKLTISCNTDLLGTNNYTNICVIDHSDTGAVLESPSPLPSPPTVERKRGAIKIKLTGEDSRYIKNIEITATNISTNQILSSVGQTAPNNSTTANVGISLTPSNEPDFLSKVRITCNVFSKNYDINSTKCTTKIFLLSDYIKQKEEITGDAINATEVSSFKKYLIDGKSVIKFKVLYGEEFLNVDANRMKIISQGSPGPETGINTEYVINTGNTDKDTSSKTYKLHYSNNSRVTSSKRNTEATTVSYTIPQKLADANNGTVSVADGNVEISNKLVFVYDSTKDNLGGEITKAEITFGSELGPMEKEVNTSSTSETRIQSTIPYRDDIKITGTSTSNYVRVDLAASASPATPLPLTIKDLNITSSSTAPILITKNTNAKITIDGTNSLTVDNATNNKHAGIELEDGTELTVDGTNTGKLTITKTGGDGAGIGTHGSGSGKCKSITIQSGNIEIAGTNGGGSGIGSGVSGTVTENINITGGTIKTETSTGAGIGSGYKGTVTGTIGISGQTKLDLETAGGAGIGAGYRGFANGTITVNIDTSDTSKYNIKTKSTTGAGIGSGQGGECSNITINGGTITINTTTGGAGIGSGKKWQATNSTVGSCGTITISPASGKSINITTDTTTGAGIGSGEESTCKAISISGGTIKPKVTGGGAGVGSGKSGSITEEITISGGTIEPQTTSDNMTTTGAGVGSGESGSCKAISISGGTIKPKTSSSGAGIGSGKSGEITENISISQESGKTTTITTNTTSGAGIGSGENGKVTGTITVSGGTVTTTSTDGAGVGSGYKSGTSGGSCKAISITGGTIKPKVTGGGSGVGSGKSGSSGAITISGGTIEAQTSENMTTTGAGVGSGESGSCTSISITGGTIKPKTSSSGAGIGSGKSGEITENISISQASGKTTTITTNTTSGAGIGSGENGKVTGTITVSGGTVTTTSTDGAGVGSGYKSGTSGGSCEAITIGGGTIKPKATGGGAGVGSGKSGSCGTITISGGTIEPQTTSDNMTTTGAGVGSGENGSCTSISMTGGTVKPKVTDGAGVGSGYKSGSSGGSCGAITISGGTVTITGTTGAGIGSGASGSCTSISISGGTINSAITGGGSGVGSGKSGSITETITISQPSGKTTTITTNTTSGAGVGSGENGSVSGKITISGGTVKTTSSNGAGIGSGYKSGTSGGSCEAIEITGGTVTPTAGAGAGIGSGNGGSCGTISISGGTIKPKVTGGGAGIGSGNSGTMGNITISGGTITYQTSGSTKYAISQTGAAIGSGYNSYNEDNSSSPTITITGGSFTIRVGDTNSNTNEGAGAGIGSGKNGGISTISISNVASINIHVWGGAGIGSGYTGTSGDITINNVGATSGTIEIEDKGGAGIGSGKEGVCGNIDVDDSTLTITTSSGAGIGSGKDGSCETIDINNNNKTITITTNSGAGIGSGKKEDATESVCGSITISNAVVKITINKAGVGIGSVRSATSGNISINNSDVKVDGAENSGALVGIGSASSNASEAITLTATKAKISGVKAGIGSTSSSKVGDIIIQENASDTRSIINISASDVGVGTADSGTVGNITINKSNLEVNSSAGEGIGCGPSASMGNISISNSNAKVNSYKTGIGSDSGYVAGNITITDSKIQSDSTNSSSYTGIGTGSLSKIGDITIKGTSASKPYNMAAKTTSNGGTGIGCGASGTVGKILLQNAQVGVSSCNVGIGCGSGGTIGKDGTDNYNIKILSCDPVQISATVVGIGKYAGTNTTVGNIAIGESAIQISGVTNSNGVGIGSTNGNLNGININGATINIATTGTDLSGAAIGGILSDNQDIVISYSKVITSTNKGVGIGGKGTSLDIDISNSKLNVATTGGGTGIGTNGDTIKDITITSCGGSVIGSGAGAGIGSGTGTVGDIEITNSEMIAINGSATTGAGVGSGENGTVANITITGSKVVAEGSNGAGIGSGQNGKVTEKIQITNGTAVTKGSTGAAIGGGNGSSSSVGTVEIDNSKVYVTADSGGAGIGSGKSGTIVNITIKNSDITSKVTSGGAGIGSGQGGSLTGKIEIDVGTSLPVSNIDVVTTSGSAIGKGSSGSANEIKIGNGIIEAVSGTESIKTPAISANTITILDGVEKFCNRGGGSDIAGRGYIKLNANVKLYNGEVTGTITRDGDSDVVYYRRLTSPMLRNQEGTATIKYGNKTATVKTDSNGDIFAWLLDGETLEVEANGLTFVIV